MSGNPLSSEPGYRRKVIRKLQQIKKLDNIGESISCSYSQYTRSFFQLRNLLLLFFSGKHDSREEEEEVKGDVVRSKDSGTVLEAVLLLLSVKRRPTQNGQGQSSTASLPLMTAAAEFTWILTLPLCIISHSFWVHNNICTSQYYSISNFSKKKIHNNSYYYLVDFCDFIHVWATILWPYNHDTAYIKPIYSIQHAYTHKKD